MTCYEKHLLLYNCVIESPRLQFQPQSGQYLSDNVTVHVGQGFNDFR